MLYPDGGVPIVLGLALVAVVALVLVKRGTPVWQAVLWAGVGFYVLAAMSKLFFPLVFDPVLRAELAKEPHLSRGNVVPLRTVGRLLGRPYPDQAIRQIGGNIGLFLPLGAVLPVLVPRLRRFSALLLTALAATLIIEAIQYVATGLGRMDRAFDIDDLLLNVVGAVLGYALWWLLYGRRSPAMGGEHQLSDPPV